MKYPVDHKNSNAELVNTCTDDGELQLVDGRNEFEGRLEICFDGTWGTVCDDSWDNRDAEVVCRQLGFNTTGAQALQASPFGQGTGPIYLDEVRCTGSELTVISCLHLPVGQHNCRHIEDAGVQCSAEGEYLSMQSNPPPPPPPAPTSHYCDPHNNLCRFRGLEELQ